MENFYSYDTSYVTNLMLPGMVDLKLTNVVMTS